MRGGAGKGGCGTKVTSSGDNLRLLEERVLLAVETITKLRTENGSLNDQLKKTTVDSRRLQQEVERMQAAQSGYKKVEDELSALKAERETVKSRIEAVLEKLAVLDVEDQ